MKNLDLEKAPGAMEYAADGEHATRRNRTDGFVMFCDGTHAVITSRSGSVSEDYWSVGQLISIQVGKNRVVGMLYKVDTGLESWHRDEENEIRIYVELVGEITENDRGDVRFSGGISTYPHLGAVAHRIRSKDLLAIYENKDARAVEVGRLSQDASIPALISIDSLISRHFAIVGTTGVGKSTAVTLLLRKIVETRPDVRILILDPHNEFSSAFPDLAVTINDRDLDLPFWMFRLEEFAEVLYRGRSAIPEEVDILRDLIPVAKAQFQNNDQPTLRRSTESTSITSDTPVPYRISDLMRLLDEQIGLLENREIRPHLKALMGRIDAAANDPRYRFMFANKTIEDNIAEVASTIYRVPANGKPITAFQMSGMPSEVVNSVASVLCRLAFDLAIWSRSRIQTLVVCEEAHRYIPTDQNAGFAPTRSAIARIAKEGRKYGVYLGIITQRPGELDETILSQCNTYFSMRLGNDRDQEIMRRAISGSSRSAINFLPSLANREAIAFGQGVSTPMRMTFQSVAMKDLPGNHLYDEQAAVQNADDSINVADVIHRMRYPRGLGDDHEDNAGKPVVQQPLGGSLVGEQRPSISSPGLELRNRPHFEDRSDAALFTREQPLRSPDRKPAGAPQESHAAMDLISRFRK
ncbi:ATP-binding protein [Oricola sp.]|uniref:ATP-binding protein n=1 Tax=Oricola sp. TaxID=1979950 RepID=UPI003BAD3FE5